MIRTQVHLMYFSIGPFRGGIDFVDVPVSAQLVSHAQSTRMTIGGIEERNQDATVYVGGLDEKTTEAILWELFLQAGPVVNVHMPKDRITMAHQG